MNIHTTAIVSKKALLGNNVRIMPYAYIDDDVEIGDNTIIGPHAVILRYTKIGANCKIHSHTVIGDLPQDITFKEAPTYVKIGNNNVIREGVTIHRGTKPESITEIGDNCYLMANSHVAHNVKIENNVIIANGALLAGYVEVGERTFISGNVLVHQFVRIGKIAMLSGGSAISKDVPPFCTTQGVSGNIILGLNIVGLRRAGILPEDRLALKRAFRTLYLSGINITEAINKIRKTETSKIVHEFCDFISSTKRGICVTRRTNRFTVDDSVDDFEKENLD